MARDEFEGVGESASDGEDYDRYVPAIQAPLTREQFEYYWGEELLTLYHQLKDTCAAGGFALFEKLEFFDFCQAAYAHSSKRKPVC